MRTLAVLAFAFTLAGQTPAPPRSLQLSISGPAVTADRNWLFGLSPLWTGGALVWVENPFSGAPEVQVFGKDGRQMAAVPLRVPAPDVVHTRGFARHPDGTVAACGFTSPDSRSYEPFLWIASPDGETLVLARTAPYCPRLVAFSTDGTVWTMGYELVDGRESNPGVNPQHGIIRRYSRTGKELGQYIPRFTIEDKNRLVNGYLVTVPNGVGWLSYAYEGDGGAYVEVSETGEVSSYAIPAYRNPNKLMSGLAVTRSGRVFFNAQDILDDVPSSVYVLDKAARSWSPVSLPRETRDIRFGLLWGAEDEALVFGLLSSEGTQILLTEVR